MTSPDCVIIDASASTVWSNPAVPESLLRGIAANPGKVIQSAACRPVKIGCESLIVEAQLTIGDRSMAVAVKQYRPRTLWKALAAIFRRPRRSRTGKRPSFSSRAISPPRGRCSPVERTAGRPRTQVSWPPSGLAARKTCISLGGELPPGRPTRDFALPPDALRH